MTRGPLVMALFLVAPLPAQTSVETGGGMARLDHYSGGAFSSFRGQLNQAFGPLRFSLNNLTIDHRGLGTSSRTQLGLKTSLSLGSWDITIGPEGKLAQGVETPFAHTYGMGLGVRRWVGNFEFIGSQSNGLARYEGDNNSWGQSELAARTTVGSFQLGSTFRNLSLRERVPRTDVFFDLGNPQSDTLYRTAQRNIQSVGLSLGWQSGRVAFSGQIGEQFAPKSAARTWWDGNLAVRVGSGMAITFGASVVPTDHLLRLRGGRFTSIGLRLGLPGDGVKQRPTVDALAFEITPIAASTYRLRFAIPGARNSATISGDITGWKPVELVRLDDGRWEVELPVKPGTYRVNVSFDGGEWAVPPGLTQVPDDFGGLVGLLVVR